MRHALRRTGVRAQTKVVAEAKREDFASGFAQCAAELLAARIFNQQEGTDIPALHGVVTAVTSGSLSRRIVRHTAPR